MRAALLSGLYCLALAGPAWAIPPVITAVEGGATLERATGPEPASIDAPLEAGDRLLTTTGMVEIVFPDGTRLYLGVQTRVELLDEALLRLWGGRVILVIPGGARAVRIDAPAASIQPEDAGEYQIALEDAAGSTRVAVVRGMATVTTDRRSRQVRAGEQIVARGSDLTEPAWFNAAAPDELRRWVEDRRAFHYGSASMDYLPPDVAPYAGVFDRHGDWSLVAGYGPVWTPRAVAGWRPYWNGRWASLPRLGLTWIGADPWSWPTHHFGRWAHRGGRWFWVPQAGWGGSWVQWATTPGFVSWSPLGPGFPITQLPSPGPVDLYRAPQAGGSWIGWTVMPRGAFERARDVPGHHVRPEWLSRDVRDRFVARRSTAARETPERMGWSPQASPRVPVAVREMRGLPVPSFQAKPSSQTPGARSPTLGTLNPTFRTGNPEPRTWNTPPRTPNFAPRTPMPVVPGILMPRASGLPAPTYPISPMAPATIAPFRAPAPLPGPVLGGFPALTPPLPVAGPAVPAAAPRPGSTR
jgi:hypothetical protein